MFATSESPNGSPAALLDELRDALARLGIEAGGHGPGLEVDRRTVDLPIVERAHPNPAELAGLVEAGEPAILVADRLSDAGRAVLREAGWSWLDRRGHLRMWVPGLRLECDFPTDGAARAPSENVWTPVGLEVALYSLIHPDEDIRARRVSRAIDRSPGSTHEMIRRFVGLGLIGPSTHRPLLPDLFWETSAHWPDDRWIALPVSIADAAARVGPGELIRVDERAATLGGARIPAVGDLPARCYVTSPAALRRLRSLAARPEDAGAPRHDGRHRCFVRLSPVRWVPQLDGFDPTDEHPWRVAHPIVCALRLAADESRGREVVEAWGIVPIRQASS